MDIHTFAFSPMGNNILRICTLTIGIHTSSFLGELPVTLDLLFSQETTKIIDKRKNIYPLH